LAEANLAIGRLDGLTSAFPDLKLFLYSYVRKEAVLSSQIEGTQSSLSDLLLWPANTYGNSLLWMNAATTGYGAASANQIASLPTAGQMSGYSSLNIQGQQAIAAQGATVDLSNSINASNLQTVGTIRANAAQREADISQLEAGSHSTDPAQHTEMATLQRINQALLIELRTQQETNQILQGQALQQIVGQKVQQDNLKALFQTGNGYQQNFDAVTPQQSSVGTQWALHYEAAGGYRWTSSF
jgi:hypothetical protein